MPKNFPSRDNGLGFSGQQPSLRQDPSVSIRSVEALILLSLPITLGALPVKEIALYHCDLEFLSLTNCILKVCKNVLNILNISDNLCWYHLLTSIGCE
jgi:hypothetical protein